MWPVVIGVCVGAVLMGRTKPKSSVRKREVIGPVTGNIYDVDDFTQTGILIVHGPSCMCALVRKAGGGFQLVNAIGQLEGIRMVCSDMDPALLKKTNG